MITHSHPLAALGAYYQTLQQSGPFARWTLLAFGAQRLGIVAQALDILLVFRPGNVTFMRIANERYPLLARSPGED